MISENGRQGDNPADARQWVSVSDAAQATKRSMRQVRNWITEGKVRAHRDERGDWRIHPDDVQVPPTTRGTSRGKRPVTETASAAPESLPRGSSVSRADAGGADDSSLMMGVEVAMLRSELAQTQAELVAVRAELASSEVLLADRTAQLVATRAALRALADAAADPTPRR